MDIEQDKEEELLMASLLQEQEPERRRRIWVRQPVQVLCSSSLAREYDLKEVVDDWKSCRNCSLS